jgi:hydrogenase/urease accessory protein HupE
MPFTFTAERCAPAGSTGRQGRLLVGLLVCLTLHLVAAAVQAHPVAQGRLEIEIFPDKIQARASVTNEEVFVENTLSSQGDVNPEQLYERHGAYLLQHLRFTADGKALSGQITGVVRPHGPGLQRAVYNFEFVLRAPPAQVRVEQNVLNEFDYAPNNRWEATYVTRVTQKGRRPVDGLLLTSRDPIAFDCSWGGTSDHDNSSSFNKWRMTRDYVRHGILHILTGYDHLLFITALVLAVVTLLDLVKVVTAFTLAHSITLTLSVLNIVRLPSQIVEPMIAASIVFVALQNVFWPERTRGATRLGVAFFFGLFHGLGFAGGLLAAMEGMAGLAVGLAILSFSIGVEIGHQLVVLPIFFGLRMIPGQNGGERSRIRDYILRYGSVAISIAGVFYLIAALRWIRAA